ncbi:MAG: C4-type zinc ribbon domain-containing protein [Proteobacteria bacterium]|nr:C4-type zinc ribbon domain-containing protein [Pseudomonadota bacterium]
MDVREQLAALAKLAEIDACVRDIESELKEIPARMDELRSNVARLRGLLEAERDQLAEAERLFKVQEEQIQEKNDSLGRSKAKAAKARTLREADAVERELEQLRRSLREREEERQRLGEAMERVRRSLGGHEREFQELEDYFADEDAGAGRRTAELTERRDEAVSGREEVAARVEAAVLRRYELVRRHRGGVAVASIKGGSCAGCHTALPPQLIIRAQKAETVEECPRCHRMLHHPAAVGAAEDPAGA